jgi:hypothetical protein
MKEAVAGSGIEIIMWNRAEAAKIDKILSGFGRKESGVVHSIRISFSLVLSMSSWAYTK